MKKGAVIGAAASVCAVGLAIFHVVHHELYCKHRSDPERSHCAVCGHRRICQRVHHRAGFSGHI